jgi:hypothetical protein
MNQLAIPLALSEYVEFLRRPETLVFAIPILAILLGGITALSKQWIRHRERMAMIERGMHPDFPDEPSQ